MILLNLLENAVKFSNKAGKVYLSLTSKENRAQKTELTLSVVDTGIGLPANEKERIFRPYFKSKR
jgi:two-component system, OmpR family, aerobic respiration control sensor histidine kinase ArcB